MELAVILFGIVLTSIGFWIKSEKPVYQEEKTTSGRIIHFLNYVDAKKYKRKRHKALFLLFIGSVIILIGIALYFFLDR